MKRSRYLLLVLVGLLLVAAILFSRWDDQQRAGTSSAARDRDQEIVFPRHKPRPRHRRPGFSVVPPPRAPLPESFADRHKPVSNDPLERAIFAPDVTDAVFVEVNAVRHSELFEKILRCREQEVLSGIEELREQIGIDPLEDLDRAVVSDDVFALSGYFDQLKIPEALGAPQPIGDSGQLYEFPIEPTEGTPSEDAPSQYLAVVGDYLLLSGTSEEEVRAAVDRVEGRAPSVPMPIEGGLGELYGTIGPAFLGELLGDAPDPVAQRLRQLVEQGVVRMTVDQHVALSMDLTAPDADTAEDLARAVAGAFSAARIDAAREGRQDVAELLEQARVKPHRDGTFDIDVAVPGDFVLNAMGCDADGHPIDAPPAAEP